MAEMSDTYKRQESYPKQPDTIMFAPSSVGESKQAEKPKKRTFEEIRAENRKHHIPPAQEPSHVTHDDHTGSNMVAELVAM